MATTTGTTGGSPPSGGTPPAGGGKGRIDFVTAVRTMQAQMGEAVDRLFAVPAATPTAQALRSKRIPELGQSLLAHAGTIAAFATNFLPKGEIWDVIGDVFLIRVGENIQKLFTSGQPVTKDAVKQAVADGEKQAAELMVTLFDGMIHIDLVDGDSCEVLDLMIDNARLRRQRSGGQGQSHTAPTPQRIKATVAQAQILRGRLRLCRSCCPSDTLPVATTKQLTSAELDVECQSPVEALDRALTEAQNIDFWKRVAAYGTSTDPAHAGLCQLIVENLDGMNVPRDARGVYRALLSGQPMAIRAAASHLGEKIKDVEAAKKARSLLKQVDDVFEPMIENELAELRRSFTADRPKRKPWAEMSWWEKFFDSFRG